MHKKLLASGLVGLVAPLAVALPADATTPGCVDRTEYRNIERGMTSAKVHRIFSTDGKQSFSGYGMQTREYKTCTSKYGFVFVDFQRRSGVWKMTGKQAYWG